MLGWVLLLVQCRVVRLQVLLEETLLVTPSVGTVLQMVHVVTGEPRLGQESLVHGLAAHVLRNELALEHVVGQFGHSAHLEAGLLASLALRGLASVLAVVQPTAWEVPTWRLAIGDPHQQRLVVAHNQAGGIAAVEVADPLRAVARDRRLLHLRDLALLDQRGLAGARARLVGICVRTLRARVPR